MKCYITKQYANKFNIPNYPLIGFWVSFGTYFNPNDLQYSLQVSRTNIYDCNAFIYSNKLTLSFDTQYSEANKYKYIYCYALDQLIYTDLNLIPITELYKYVAMVIELDSDRLFIGGVREIIDINYSIKCSIKLATDDPIINHYVSDNIGTKLNVDDPNVCLIDKESGLNKMRSDMTPVMDSTLTMDNFGLINIF